jgi:DNA-binding LacI/PurR family transcriptional regulator
VYLPRKGRQSLTSKKRRVTSHEVAALAGVSRSAVSRTFTLGASVSNKTREKVLGAADKLGYQPNVIARSLITRKSHLIGLVMADWLNPYYTAMLQSYIEKLQNKNYQVIFATINKGRDVDASIKFLMQYQVDGIIIVSALPSAATSADCFQKNTPIVFLNRLASSIGACSVTLDHIDLGSKLADVAIDFSYKRFALIRGDEKVKTGAQRTTAFIKRIEEHKKGKVVADLVGIIGYDQGRAAFADIMKLKSKPDLIMCSSDLTALGMMDGARIDFNLEIPKDVGFIGFGNAPASSWGLNQLTTIKLPIDSMIDASINYLLTRIDDPKLPPESCALRADIIFRDTTKKP